MIMRDKAGKNPFSRLAKLAKTEQWNFISSQFKRPGQEYPILTNYLNYTFMRIQSLDIIQYSSDGDRACFNTGLQNPHDQDIYITFNKNKNAEERNHCDWFFYNFAPSISDRLNEFRPLPTIATYIKDYSDLVFDVNLKLIPDFDHIIYENKDRLPVELQNNDALARNAINGAIESMKHRLMRNYKLAVPQWYENRVQLLLPLCLIEDNVPSVALVVDKDNDNRVYKARTILPIDAAYQNARLICTPNREWLNP